MKCVNCKCIVPDSCEYCIYCGHPMPPSGSTRTIPVQEYTNNVTHYCNVSDKQNGYGRNDVHQHEYYGSNNYADYGYRRYPENYRNAGYNYDGYNHDPYYNGQPAYYAPTAYNEYGQRGYYDNREAYDYTRRTPARSQKGDNKISRILLLLIVADILSLMTVLIVLLLFIL